MAHSMVRCLSDSLLLSEWADTVNSALEPGGTGGLVAPPTVGLQDKSGFKRGSIALENAKTYLNTLAGNRDEQGWDLSKFGNRFTDKLILHQSGNATIVQSRDRQTGNSVILKVYDKKMLSDELGGRVELEKRALERCMHANIVDLLHVEDDRSTFTLVLENCVLGDLVRQVALLKQQPSESSIFPTIIRQVLLGVQHMHEQGLVHCGISPTSVLLRADKSVCLCDLFHVFDTHDVRNHRRRHRAGSLDYMPPEMIHPESARGEHSGATLGASQRNFITPAVDIWQVGCLAFELLAGRAPFELESVEQTATAILHGQITAWPSTFQQSSIDFIDSCLQKVPERRPMVEELLQHPVLVPQGVDPGKAGLDGAHKTLAARLGIRIREILGWAQKPCSIEGS